MAYQFAPVLWNSLPADLRHVSHHVTPAPILNSILSLMVFHTGCRSNNASLTNLLRTAVIRDSEELTIRLQHLFTMSFDGATKSSFGIIILNFILQIGKSRNETNVTLILTQVYTYNQYSNMIKCI